MKTLILFLSLAISHPKADSVYVCTGKYSKAYHATLSCKGLRNCKGAELKVSMADAKKMNRTPCGICEK